MKQIKDEYKGIIFIALIVVIIVTISIIFSISLKTNVVEDVLSNNRGVNVLFVVEDETEEMLFSNVVIYYPESQKAALVNLPGYVGAIFNTLGRVDKLKKVYEEAGIDNYKLEVEKLLGIKIPFYTIIKMNDFIRLSDYLGGMRVFIPEPIDIISDNGNRWLLPSGAVNLDGDKINSYLHYRFDDEGEADVQDRYQNAMSALITGIHDKKFLIFNNKDNFKKYSDCFITNIDDEEELTLFKNIADIDTESIIKQTITGSMRNVDGQQLLFPLNNGEFIKEAVKQTSNMLISADGTYATRVYVLEIQNGTTVQGLARNTSILFQNASYDVLSAVNADSNNYEHTIIIDHIGNEEVAKMVGEFIHCTNIVQEDSDMEVEGISGEANVDFTIILGKDFNGRYVVPSRTSN